MAFDQRYFDDQTQVRLHCDGPDCWAEILRSSSGQTSECSTDEAQQLRVELEFLLQPRDNAQRPVGPPLLLHSLPLQLTPRPQTGWLHAWAWLPPLLTPPLLKKCHLRLQLPVGSATRPQQT